VRDVKDRHVNDYIQSIIGANFTAKDFRTWAGTLLCSIALGTEGQGASKTERKRKIKRAVQATADQLGNTPAVCRSSYICPRLLDEYMEGKPFEMLRKHHKGSPVVRIGLSKEERALLKFLRETIADRRKRAMDRRIPILPTARAGRAVAEGDLRNKVARRLLLRGIG
jgi:DNA topoisomerase I